jgi:hypothetical protein
MRSVGATKNVCAHAGIIRNSKQLVTESPNQINAAVREQKKQQNNPETYYPEQP